MTIRKEQIIGLIIFIITSQIISIIIWILTQVKCFVSLGFLFFFLFLMIGQIIRYQERKQRMNSKI